MKVSKVDCIIGSEEIITQVLTDDLVPFSISNNPTYKFLYSNVAVIYSFSRLYNLHLDLTFLSFHQQFVVAFEDYSF